MTETTDGDLMRLKLQIKRWEKAFETKEHRKPNSADIESSNISAVYKSYWSLVKRKPLSEKQVKQSVIQQNTNVVKDKTKGEVWGAKFNKKESKKMNKNVKKKFIICLSERIKKIASGDENVSIALKKKKNSGINELVEGSPSQGQCVEELENNTINVFTEPTNASNNSKESALKGLSVSGCLEPNNFPENNDCDKLETANESFHHFNSLKRKSDVLEEENYEYTEQSDDECADNKSDQDKDATEKEVNVRRHRKVADNYLRLNLRKKVFCSRGYKKVNVQKQKRKIWKQKQQSKNRDKCYNCWEDGHWAKDCPKRKTNTASAQNDSK